MYKTAQIRQITITMGGGEEMKQNLVTSKI